MPRCKVLKGASERSAAYKDHEQHRHDDRCEVSWPDEPVEI